MLRSSGGQESAHLLEDKISDLCNHSGLLCHRNKFFRRNHPKLLILQAHQSLCRMNFSTFCIINRLIINFQRTIFQRPPDRHLHGNSALLLPQLIRQIDPVLRQPVIVFRPDENPQLLLRLHLLRHLRHPDLNGDRHPHGVELPDSGELVQNLLCHRRSSFLRTAAEKQCKLAGSRAVNMRSCTLKPHQPSADFSQDPVRGIHTEHHAVMLIMLQLHGDGIGRRPISKQNLGIPFQRIRTEKSGFCIHHFIVVLKNQKAPGHKKRLHENGSTKIWIDQLQNQSAEKSIEAGQNVPEILSHGFPVPKKQQHAVKDIAARYKRIKRIKALPGVLPGNVIRIKKSADAWEYRRHCKRNLRNGKDQIFLPCKTVGPPGQLEHIKSHQILHGNMKEMGKAGHRLQNGKVAAADITKRSCRKLGKRGKHQRQCHKRNKMRTEIPDIFLPEKSKQKKKVQKPRTQIKIQIVSAARIYHST